METGSQSRPDPRPSRTSRPHTARLPGPAPARLAALFLAVVVGGGCAGESDGPRTATADDPDARYMCPPCHVHEDLFFAEDGVCPVCGMNLVERPDTSRLGEAHVHVGSGNFLLEGGPAHRERLIQVFYHRPERFTPRSPVLLVVPGAGRDADEYRDAWVDASERHGVLVLSPMYRESEYGFGAYHMGGLMEGMNLPEAVLEEEGSNRVHLDEERFEYRVVRDPERWIFQDFDRIFERVVDAVGSEREGYDLFGHSAGGQILHRLAIFAPETRAHRILAGNSGFYTLPDTTVDLPFGVRDAPVTLEQLESALGRRLVLLLGERDDASETGGTLLRSPTVDQQGLHRLERGRHVFEVGRALAEGLGVDFGWEMEVVPGVGHDHRGMSRAAAELLYGDGARVEPAPGPPEGPPGGGADVRPAGG